MNFLKKDYNKLSNHERMSDMYQRGNQVIYGAHGVCKIIDIEIKKMAVKQLNIMCWSLSTSLTPSFMYLCIMKPLSPSCAPFFLKKRSLKYSTLPMFTTMYGFRMKPSENNATPV